MLNSGFLLRSRFTDQFEPILINFKQEDAADAAAVTAAIETKDWNELVDIVLRGQADLLLDRTSEDSEIQEFIKNAELFNSKVKNINKGK